MKSLVIGFCTCAKCGWTSGKFNWHTYFKCPECGCKEYIKEGSCFDAENEDTDGKGTNFPGTDDNNPDSKLCV